ncbi:MAG TPA: hypothetical protein VNW26_04880 [Steroidobacteraceae bacterium]|nr:hypothetical protein [Steroidobacteraceae bacterium]
MAVALGTLSMGGATGSPLGADPAASSDACKMTTTFPDHTTFAEACVATIVLPGEDRLAPRGGVQLLDAGKRAEVFNMNFFLPKEIKPNVTYAISTDSTESFLHGIVQPPAAHELCRMTKTFPTNGTVTFTAVGATGAALHGAVQVYPACFVNLGTPEQTLVPGGQVGGGKTMIVF